MYKFEEGHRVVTHTLEDNTLVVSLFGFYVASLAKMSSSETGTVKAVTKTKNPLVDRLEVITEFGVKYVYINYEYPKGTQYPHTYCAVVLVFPINITTHVKEKPTPHEHSKCIKAWADGYEIEWLSYFESEWQTVPNPQWTLGQEYRIKPYPLSEVKLLQEKVYNLEEDLRQVFVKGVFDGVGDLFWGTTNEPS